MLSTTELSQFLKIPAFIGHYFEHKEQNQDLTLWEFVYIHYAFGDVQSSDYEQDMKLPFKTHETCTTTLSVFFLPNAFVFSSNKVFVDGTKKTFLNKDELIPSIFLSNIWQPPRLA
jgi:hypothetical protein